ncbi:hypothetical protein FNV43_RR05552 [Rhamnella rubrinervis]|uniref:Uncharacterized protein n=1 Tax=Rhamnella rubrinervis TaxID=2594499 RepID=A0A8K0MR76_9ROSA|nr:hypothetical protein FNV43_RR05552 [Rhamnella rubrinervis]
MDLQMEGLVMAMEIATVVAGFVARVRSDLQPWIRLLQLSCDLIRGIGIPLRIDNYTLLGNCVHFAWVLVDMDLAGFVLKKLLLEMTDDCIEVDLYFESFLNFCTSCHSVNHSMAMCKSEIGRRLLKLDIIATTKRISVQIILESVLTSSYHNTVPRQITLWEDAFGNLDDEISDDANDIIEDKWSPLLCHPDAFVLDWKCLGTESQKIDCEHPVVKTNKGVSNMAEFTQGTLPKQSSVPSFAEMVRGTAGRNIEITTGIQHQHRGAAYTIPTTNQNAPTRKGNFVLIKVNDNAYKERISLCQFSLIARVVLTKGDKSWKHDELYLKLQSIWKLEKWKLISLGRGYFSSSVILYGGSSKSLTDHADKDNTKGKGVQTVSSYIGVVHSDTVLNDTFDDLDDELPVHEDGVLQDPSDMQILDQDRSTSGDQINMDTTMVLYDPTKTLSAAQQNLDLVASDHSVSETKDPNAWTTVKAVGFRTAVLPTMWVFTSRSLEDARILLSEKQIVSVNIMRVGGAHERSGGGPPIHSSCTDFQAAVEAAGLLPIDTHEDFFTWGRRGTRGYVQSKLDRSFCSDSCLEVSDSIACCILAKHHSDHHPLLLSLSKLGNVGPRPFRFQSMWLLNKDFKFFVQSIWDEEVAGSPFHRVIAKLKKVKHALWSWNRDIFGDIHVKISLAQEKLLSI